MNGVQRYRMTLIRQHAQAGQMTVRYHRQDFEKFFYRRWSWHHRRLKMRAISGSSQMRSMISPDCATTRRSLYDQFPSESCAKRSTVLRYPQGSPVPEMPGHVSKRVVRRAGLLSLQEFKRLADRCAIQVQFCPRKPLEIPQLTGTPATAWPVRRSAAWHDVYDHRRAVSAVKLKCRGVAPWLRPSSKGCGKPLDRNGGHQRICRSRVSQEISRRRTSCIERP